MAKSRTGDAAPTRADPPRGAEAGAARGGRRWGPAVVAVECRRCDRCDLARWRCTGWQCGSGVVHRAVGRRCRRAPRGA